MVPVEGHGGSLCRVCALIAIDTRLKAASGGTLLDMERSNAIGGVRRAVASTLKKAPNRVLVIQDITDWREAKVFRAHAAPQGVCDRKMVTAQDGGTGLSRGRLRITRGLRRFIMVDNHEAVKDGDLEKNVESRSVVKPKFTTEFLEAVVREAAEELTLRAEEAGAWCTFIDTQACGTQKSWEPPLVARHLPGYFPRASKERNGRPWATLTRSCTKR